MRNSSKEQAGIMKKQKKTEDKSLFNIFTKSLQLPGTTNLDLHLQWAEPRQVFEIHLFKDLRALNYPIIQSYAKHVYSEGSPIA